MLDGSKPRFLVTANAGWPVPAVAAVRPWAGAAGERGNGRAGRGLEPAIEPLLGEKVQAGVLLVAAVVAAVEPDHVHRGAGPLNGAVVGVGLVQAEE